MRVVLDANIWVSAAIRTGPAHRIVQAGPAGSASSDVVICPALIAKGRRSPWSDAWSQHVDAVPLEFVERLGSAAEGECEVASWAANERP